MTRHVAAASLVLLFVALFLVSVAVGASPDRPPDTNGWYSGPLAIAFSGPDESYGCDPPATYGGPDDASVTISGTCSNGTDTVVDTFGPFAYDDTDPTISGEKSPAGDGWTNQDVAVGFTCADNLSGIALCPGPATVTSSGAGQQVTGTAEDVAGNRASATVGGINIDKISPSITGSPLPAPNANGWTDGPVWVTFSCTDGLSGVASCSPPQVLSSEGSGQSRSGNATDVAGNTAGTTVSGINIDLTAPEISEGSASPPANGFGWNDEPVTVTFSCTDALSGVISDTVSETVTTEGVNQIASGTCEDRAGNTTFGLRTGASIDLTPPTIFGTRSPAPNANGWNNTDVKVDLTCFDFLSGLDITCPDVTLASNGPDQSVTHTVRDRAGHEASATVSGISIDKIDPNVVANVPPPNSFGWYTDNVTITFTCSDALSGVESCPEPVTLAGEGVGQSVTRIATDRAGNQASVTASGIDIDKTPPVLTPPPLALAEANGPNGSIVNFPIPTFTDPDFGPVPAVSCDPDSPSLFPIGTSTVTCSAPDGHGNNGTGSFAVTVQDTTPPVLPNIPDEIVAIADDAAGATKANVAVAAVFNIVAGDIGDPSPAVTITPDLAVYPIGTTILTITAEDRFGNTSSKVTSLKVRFGSTAGGGEGGRPVAPFRPPKVLDFVAPPDPPRVTAQPGNHRVKLIWGPSSAPDLKGYVVTRFGGVALAGVGGTIVYRGPRTTYTDRKLRNGIEYRYVIAAEDKAGNLSAGVAVTVVPGAKLLARPVDGSRVKPPITLFWVPVPQAAYFNVQIFRGKEKILSAWPRKATFKLPVRWTFEGKSYRLRPGNYRWYVWPGFGKKVEANYGPMMGKSTFVVGAKASQARSRP